MRKLTAFFTLCLLLACCFAFPLSARADVIYDPIGDLINAYSGVGIAVLILIAVVAAITLLLLWLLKRRK